LSIVTIPFVRQGKKGQVKTAYKKGELPVYTVDSAGDGLRLAVVVPEAPACADARAAV
jgi:hypothetical protein